MKALKAASLLFTASFLSTAAPVHAQDKYPSRPIRLIIPWPAGGITDVISRSLGSVLSDALEQQVVPDNRPGAAGTLGTAIALSANPDGYTLLMTDVTSHAVTATLYKKLPYHPFKDIEPIALPSRSPLALVVNPKYGINSIKQLIEHAKAQPGQFPFASSGPGSTTHMTAERFKRDAGVNLLHVPYKGSGPATAAIVAGEAGMMFACISPAIPHVKAGRLKLLGLTAAQRSPLFPDVPVVKEAIPGFVMGCNTGFWAVVGTPRAILDRLHAEVMKAVNHPRMQQVLTANSAESAPYTRAEFKKHVAEELKAWGDVVRASGVKVE